MSPKFKIVETFFDKAYLIEPTPFIDERGFFVESYNKKEFDLLGVKDVFIQDNHSHSIKNVIRGIHFQLPPHETSKLVRCIKGKILDVVVDLRKDSPTYRQWKGFEISEENKQMVYVPRGFGHGFCVLSDEADVCYKVDEYYYPESDGGVRWNDPNININWPVEKAILSVKDSSLPFLNEIENIL